MWHSENSTDKAVWLESANGEYSVEWLQMVMRSMGKENKTAEGKKFICIVEHMEQKEQKNLSGHRKI